MVKTLHRVKMGPGGDRPLEGTPADVHLLCMQSPSVQLWDWSTGPSQSCPPFLGTGLLHSLFLHWVHSVPQGDHLVQSVQPPSTGEGRRVDKNNGSVFAAVITQISPMWAK